MRRKTASVSILGLNVYNRFPLVLHVIFRSAKAEGCFWMHSVN